MLNVLCWVCPLIFVSWISHLFRIELRTKIALEVFPNFFTDSTCLVKQRWQRLEQSRPSLRWPTGRRPWPTRRPLWWAGRRWQPSVQLHQPFYHGNCYAKLDRFTNMMNFLICKIIYTSVTVSQYNKRLVKLIPCWPSCCCSAG